MPSIDQLILPQLLGIILVVAHLVMGPLHAVEEREVLVAHGVAEHEGGNSGRVRLESEGDQPQHQVDMLGVIHLLLAEAARVTMIKVHASTQCLDVSPRGRVVVVLRRPVA